MQNRPDPETLRWFDEFAYREFSNAKALATCLLKAYSCPLRDADDIVQDVFLIAFRKAEKLRRHPNQRAWIFKTVHNVFKNYYRSWKKHMREVPLEYHSDLPDSIMIEETIINRDMLLRMTRFLTDQEYELYRFVHCLGYPTAQIAQLLNIRTDTASRRISRLNKKLQKIYLQLSESGIGRHISDERSSQ